MSPIDPQRRDVLKAVGSAGALFGVGGVGTVSARNGKRKGASAESTIAEIAAGSDDFETLVAALEATGLDSVLNSDDGQYTVFAPTDDAFDGVDTSQLSTAALENVLRYHVTEGRRYAPSVVNAPAVETLNGDSVTVDGTTLNEGQATIVGTDIEASNGVVHVIDGVLLP
ncbi:fasciclin domain-containing protein [Natrinema salsiterrestre]|uniref:Fasciclin domain-containing protein n=1 Tax=Natrinema salsiterrestre TaxID=2950540 RepID=A0A9Q4PZI3_9EURY|nr:fasciclin domain-containing protein [Natrinema salsiterrestre]MDF9744900.1 fasciclin domain-containing protein [Natrinema salsiterrestre]